MPITYDDIKHRLQPPLDCSELKDLRGRYFHNRLIINYENTDFTGCVLFHCFPSGIENALEINPAQSEKDVTLKDANLSRANLLEANLYKANLEGANLEGADLSGADLEDANLGWANLQGADLENVNFRFCDIQHTKFINANLVNADFRGARFWAVDFSGADVKGVKVGGRHLTEILSYIVKSDNVKNFDKIEIVEV